MMTKRHRVCFLGTPDFADSHLQALLQNPDYQVVGVVTQPDRPAGRKMQLTPSPVKKTALEKSLPVLTPEKLRNEPEAMQKIFSWQADVAVVVAFGQILPQEFLDGFSYGAVNVHGSLLPQWRGAAPIQRALEAGDRLSGVTLQRVVKKLDAGPVIGKREIILDDVINATELYGKLALLGQELLQQDLLKYLNGQLIPQEQDESLVSIAKKIEKSEGQLSWQLSAREFHNRVRAFTMGPGTFIPYKGQRMKIHRTAVVSESGSGVPSSILLAESDKLHVQTAQGALALLELQPESKNKINVRDFLKSNPLRKGDLFV